MIQASSSAGQVYTDLNALQGIRTLGKQDKSAALMEVAKQFESMFVNMMLSSMRQANSAFSEDSLLSSPQSDFYQNMYDQQLGLSLSTGRGLGLADVIHRQLLDNYGNEQTAVELDHSKLADRRLAQSAIRWQQAVDQVEAVLAQEPSEAAVVEGSKGQQFATPQAFVAALYPQAREVAEQLGVDAKAIVAQAALETGWGKHMIRSDDGRNSYNFFGIKADSRWSGDSVEVTTHEYRDGVAVKEKARFRSYDSMQAGLQDYALFLQNHTRYQDAIHQGLDGSQYGHALQRAGYATDPAYGQKIERISSGDLLQQAVQALEVNDG
ncbi:flagellar assembly peptidoglycan hydrolase FlgJ [Bacterioplanes sanyensis]|uniref:Peptidoglycan hydrolase FlgJ n=1 Tax=Bacterioplanes sanyensis TaxID=1249553 RepID=A0A222FQ18_9GAMM|nr:flagellar assembly peptidoglycan hydrolase FlgJ [Bacterioplanes sanyensis]ASP40614.1 flagellar assembly peptidoglycan hydrolase FlgJ [Bacterioplanes sanyensis]